MASQRAMSFTDELTPPAGVWASASRWKRGSHLSPTLTWLTAWLGRAAKSANRELVDAMPSGRYSTSSERSSHGLPAAAATASAAAVTPKLV